VIALAASARVQQLDGEFHRFALHAPAPRGPDAADHYPALDKVG